MPCLLLLARLARLFFPPSREVAQHSLGRMVALRCCEMRVRMLAMPRDAMPSEVTRRVTHDAELLLVMVCACVCAYFLVWRPVREGPRSGHSIA